MGSMEKLLQSIPSTLMESLLPMTNLASTSDLEQPVIMSVHATQVIQTLSPHLLAIWSVAELTEIKAYVLYSVHKKHLSPCRSRNFLGQDCPHS